MAACRCWVGGTMADLERPRPCWRWSAAASPTLARWAAGSRPKAVNQVLVAGSYPPWPRRWPWAKKLGAADGGGLVKASPAGRRAPGPGRTGLAAMLEGVRFPLGFSSWRWHRKDLAHRSWPRPSRHRAGLPIANGWRRSKTPESRPAGGNEERGRLIPLVSRGGAALSATTRTRWVVLRCRRDATKSNGRRSGLPGSSGACTILNRPPPARGGALQLRVLRSADLGAVIGADSAPPPTPRSVGSSEHHVTSVALAG